MKTFLKKKLAFTLVEALIVVAVGSAIGTALLFVVQEFNRMAAYNGALAESSGSSSAIVNEVAKLVRKSDFVLATHDVLGTPYVSSETTLVLELPAIDEAGAVVENTYDYVAVYSENGIAYRVLDANTLSSRASGVEKLGSQVQTLSFAYDKPTITETKLITVAVETSTTASGYALSDSRREDVRLRNR